MATHDATEMMNITAGLHRHHARRPAERELDHAISLHDTIALTDWRLTYQE
jgi:hypothetical protein